jgi:phosphate transport system protein
MNNIHTSQHIFRRFDTELEDIHRRVLTMGGLVEQQLADAITALVDSNIEKGRLVGTRDFEVNRMEVAIDEECTNIIALRQPAAGDLRLIIAVIKTITDLERIGDEAERIGHMATVLSEADRNNQHFNGIELLAKQVQEMLHGALDAFARTDVEAAVNVWQKDRKADSQYESLLRQLITYMMEDPRSIPWVLDVIWSARALERIGDRSRNICEYVIYLVKGKDVRHTSLEHMAREIE